MAQVSFAFSDLEELIPIGIDEAVEKLTLLGFPAEKTAEGLNVEVTPNRPDCLCVEGLARALRCFQLGAPQTYEVGKASISASVDKSVLGLRPAFGCAVVRELSISDSLLRSIMQVQEKLHETLGRKRRKVAIGIHDLDRVVPPFRYLACGRQDVRFVPLDESEEMTPDEILQKHKKGIEYAHLVGEKCPMILDSRGKVLSFPPIINGELTRLTPATRNVFVDCTGTSEVAVRQAVNIICAMLADRGGKIQEVELDGKPYELLRERKMALPVAEAERVLGMRFSQEEVSLLLAKMGYRVEGRSAYVPGYRTDVISEIDLIEDIAIAYGFNNFEPTLPDFFSAGSCHPEHPFHELMVGLGYTEAISWLLSNKEQVAKAKTAAGSLVEIENPLTTDFTIFRPSILQNLLSILAESKDEPLPIRLYEIGTVAAPHIEERLCFVSMHSKAGFSEAKGVVLALAGNCGMKAELREEQNAAFIAGRCASVYLDGRKAGAFGEISPEVLSAFRLEQPVCAGELRVSPPKAGQG
ncbi:MAG: phenylalanine--tRNA ligase subunit beta [Candidatus Micrarchaeota archaeon]|nr:phenylalanine--tRNA ligase subunit beta [Candidatus Micrarchaeota archaeon]